MTRRVIVLGVFGVAAALGAALAGPAGPVAPAPTIEVMPVPDIGPESGPFANRCRICHGDMIILQQRLTREQWKAELAKMEKFGAPLAAGSDEEAQLLENLARVLPADASPPVFLHAPPRLLALPRFEDVTAPVPGADAARGAEKFQAACAACHPAGDGSDRGPFLRGRPVLADLEAFSKVVRDGRGGMPANPTLAPGDVADLLAFLRKRTAER